MPRFSWRCFLVAPFLMLLAGPAWAVVGEVTVMEGGEGLPGASVTIEFEDGSETTAQEDEDRPGVYVFQADEDKAAQSLDVHVTRDDRTDTKAGVTLTRTMVDGEPRYAGTVDLGAGPGMAKAAPGAARKPRTPGPSITASGGHTTVDLPQASYFRTENLGIITVFPTFEDDDQPTGKSVSVDVNIPSAAGLSLGFRHTGAMSRFGNESINANGANFGLFTPGNGFVTGQNLVNVTAMREYTDYGGRLTLSPWSWELPTGSLYDLFFGVEGGTMATDAMLEMSIGGSTDYMEMRWMGNDYYGVIVGGTLAHPIGENTSLYGGWEAGVRYNDFDAMWQVDVEGFQSRTQEFSDTEFTVGAQLKAGFAYQVGALGSIFIEAGGGTFEVPTIEFADPTQGDGGATLELDRAFSYRINAGFRVDLGALYSCGGCMN